MKNFQCVCFINVSFVSVMDTNDRFLRKITIGQASTEKGFSREVDKVPFCDHKICWSFDIENIAFVLLSFYKCRTSLW